MSTINRAPYNALVDDDGSGTVGTTWSKDTVKTVLLDPIDAAIAAVPIGTAAVGQVLVSAGVGVAAVWSANPALTSLSLSGSLTAGVGPHALGGAASSLSQLLVTGSFAERIGVEHATTLAPPAGTSARGLWSHFTFTEAGSGAHTLLASHWIDAATVTPGAATVTDTASLYIAGAMAATVTGKNYAAWIGGLTRIDGNLNFGAPTSANLLLTADLVTGPSFRFQNGDASDYAIIVTKDTYATRSIITPLVTNTGDLILETVANNNIIFKINGANRLYLNQGTLFPLTDLGLALGGPNNRFSNGYFGTARFDGLVQFGGATASFPALKRNGAGIDFRLADDSGYTTATLSGLTILGNSLLLGTGANAIRLFTNSDGILQLLNPALSAVQALRVLTLTADSFVMIGANPTNAGGVRLGNSSATISARNAANTANITYMQIDGSNSVYVADNLQTTVLQGTTILPQTDNTIDLGSAGGRWRIGYFATALTVGSNPADSGAVRLPNGTTINFRNVANTGNIAALTVNSSNYIVLDPNNTGMILGSASPIIAIGGASVSFPAIKRNTIFVQLRLADDSGPTGAITANLPAGVAARDGIIGFDTTINALVYYVGGNRYKLAGVAF